MAFATAPAFSAKSAQSSFLAAANIIPTFGVTNFAKNWMKPSSAMPGRQRANAVSPLASSGFDIMFTSSAFMSEALIAIPDSHSIVTNAQFAITIPNLPPFSSKNRTTACLACFAPASPLHTDG